MDRSVENIHLIMTKENLDFNEKQLPEGYEFVAYEPGMIDKWVDIQLSSKHILEKSEGERYFKQIFLQNEDFFKRVYAVY